jgi:hypothetical protein
MRKYLLGGIIKLYFMYRQGIDLRCSKAEERTFTYTNSNPYNITHSNILITSFFFFVPFTKGSTLKALLAEDERQIEIK